MTNFWLDTLNCICASSLIALSFIDNITKKSYSRQPELLKFLLNTIKKLSVKFIVVSFFGLTSIWVNYKKNQNVEADKQQANNFFQVELNKRDSTNQIKLNESLSESASASSQANAETMAKYYLLYDSVQHKIEKLVKDSSKQIINSYTDAKPEFDINDIRFIKSRNDTLEFQIVINCKKTAIENLNLKLQLYLFKQGQYTYCPQIIGLMPKDVYMSSNTLQTIDNINITSLKNIFEAYFHIYGAYEYNGKKIPVDFIMFYNFKDSKWGIPGKKGYLVNLFKELP
ncbi:MAG: hypothetical protein JWQ06_2382 [Mucilaginibacter sp.]|nr:hypothetical protein [Mucilaginibacter sp.]